MKGILVVDTIAVDPDWQIILRGSVRAKGGSNAKSLEG
jgi:hypothetical protein